MAAPSVSTIGNGNNRSHRTTSQRVQASLEQDARGLVGLVNGLSQLRENMRSEVLRSAKTRLTGLFADIDGREAYGGNPALDLLAAITDYEENNGTKPTYGAVGAEDGIKRRVYFLPTPEEIERLVTLTDISGFTDVNCSDWRRLYSTALTQALFGVHSSRVVVASHVVIAQPNSGQERDYTLTPERGIISESTIAQLTRKTLEGRRAGRIVHFEVAAAVRADEDHETTRPFHVYTSSTHPIVVVSAYRLDVDSLHANMETYHAENVGILQMRREQGRRFAPVTTR